MLSALSALVMFLSTTAAASEVGVNSSDNGHPAVVAMRHLIENRTDACSQVKTEYQTFCRMVAACSKGSEDHDVEELCNFALSQRG